MPRRVLVEQDHPEISELFTAMRVLRRRRPYTDIDKATDDLLNEVAKFHHCDLDAEGFALEMETCVCRGDWPCDVAAAALDLAAAIIEGEPRG